MNPQEGNLLSNGPETKKSEDYIDLVAALDRMLEAGAVESLPKIEQGEDEIHQLLMQSGRNQEDIASTYQKVLEGKIEVEMIIKGKKGQVMSKEERNRIYDIRDYLDELRYILRKEVSEKKSKNS